MAYTASRGECDQCGMVFDEDEEVYCGKCYAEIERSAGEDAEETIRGLIEASRAVLGPPLNALQAADMDPKQRLAREELEEECISAERYLRENFTKNRQPKSAEPAHA